LLYIVELINAIVKPKNACLSARHTTTYENSDRGQVIFKLNYGGHMLVI